MLLNHIMEITTIINNYHPANFPQEFTSFLISISKQKLKMANSKKKSKPKPQPKRMPHAKAKPKPRPKRMPQAKAKPKVFLFFSFKIIHQFQ